MTKIKAITVTPCAKNEPSLGYCLYCLNISAKRFDVILKFRFK